MWCGTAESAASDSCRFVYVADWCATEIGAPMDADAQLECLLALDANEDPDLIPELCVVTWR
jgi:hypothetical protein